MLLFSALYAQAQDLGATDMDYDDVFVDENSDTLEVQQGIVLTQLEMLKDIIHEDVYYNQFVLQSTSGNVNRDALTALEQYYKVNDGSEGFNPWAQAGGASGFGAVPYKPQSSGYDKWVHSKFEVKLTVSLDAIAKWKWPTYDPEKKKWKHGSILTNLRINPKFSVSYKGSIQFMVLWLPLVFSYGVDLTIAPMLNLCAIKDFRAEHLGDIDPEDALGNDTIDLIRTPSQYAALIKMIFALSGYTIDYTTTGLVVTITLMPWVSIGIGCDLWQPLQFKVRCIFTLTISATPTKASKIPSVANKNPFRVVFQINFNALLILDMIFFTNTWSFPFWPKEGESDVVYDSWAESGQAEIPSGAYIANNILADPNEISKMNIVSESMLSQTSESEGVDSLESLPTMTKSSIGKLHE